MLATTLTRAQISEINSSFDSAFAWCQNQGLLMRDPVCTKCGSPLTAYLDKKVYRCYRRSCEIKISIFERSIFKRMKTDLQTALSIIYEWSSGIPVKYAADTLGLTRSTVSNWYRQIRGLVRIFCDLETPYSIGGQGIIVEIDQFLLVKNNNRRVLAGQQWVIAGIERGNPSSFFY